MVARVALVVALLLAASVARALHSPWPRRVASRFFAGTDHEPDPAETTNDNYVTPKHPLKVRVAKDRRVFNMGGAGQDGGGGGGDGESVLSALEAACTALVAESKSKFMLGDFADRGKGQMGTWIDPSHLARVFRLLNESALNVSASSPLYRLDTMKVLRVPLLRTPDFALSLFHVPAHAALPWRRHAEGTVLVYKAAYGSGRLDSLTASAGNLIASEALEAAPAVTGTGTGTGAAAAAGARAGAGAGAAGGAGTRAAGAAGAAAASRSGGGGLQAGGTLFRRLGGPRRVAAWARAPSSPYTRPPSAASR